MNKVAAQAEEYVRQWFKITHGIELERNPDYKGKGFDFRIPAGGIV